MLPKKKFSASLIRHLLLYYDRRFESNKHLNHFIFNQKMRYFVIKTITRSGSSNKKYLDKLGKFLKDEVFKKFLADAVENPNEKPNIMRFSRKQLSFSPFEGSQ